MNGLELPDLGSISVYIQNLLFNVYYAYFLRKMCSGQNNDRLGICFHPYTAQITSPETHSANNLNLQWYC